MPLLVQWSERAPLSDLQICFGLANPEVVIVAVVSWEHLTKGN